MIVNPFDTVHYIGPGQSTFQEIEIHILMIQGSEFHLSMAVLLSDNTFRRNDWSRYTSVP